jgi:hypothetical protein
LNALPVPDNLDKSTEERKEFLATLKDLWSLQPSAREISVEDEDFILRARWAYYSGDLEEAVRILASCNVADALNMRGVIWELLGDHRAARSLYQAAAHMEPQLYSATMNLRRSFELWEFGQTDIPLLL